MDVISPPKSHLLQLEFLVEFPVLGEVLVVLKLILFSEVIDAFLNGLLAVLFELLEVQLQTSKGGDQCSVTLLGLIQCGLDLLTALASDVDLVKSGEEYVDSCCVYRTFFTSPVIAHVTNVPLLTVLLRT